MIEELRPGRLETDLDDLAALMSEGFATYMAFAPEGWTPPPMRDFYVSWQKRLTDHRWTLVAQAPTGRLTGAACALLPDETDPHHAALEGHGHLAGMWIAADRRGQGLGGQLLFAAEQYFRDQGVAAAQLWAVVGAPAVQFYAAHRWEERDSKADAFNDGLNVVRMVKTL